MPVDLPPDGAELRVMLEALTSPQRAALALFKPGQKRRAFPDINPRSATALWRKGLLQGLHEGGKTYFLLSDQGVRIWRIVCGGHVEAGPGDQLESPLGRSSSDQVERPDNAR
ncbi:hypothetical protein FHT00_003579 [Sphingomonas insulae]|uniref:Uncharacterized protein n=1 Tax=Sphingomonas insulae TaxID=424800 RepID=A0ABN1HN75_9SPHN|nr:hypothetical protein [Sphingomonas insulae]